MRNVPAPGPPAAPCPQGGTGLAARDPFSMIFRLSPDAIDLTALVSSSLLEIDGLPCNLAIVQRIIRRHGGQAWAEGAEGAGACFHFTLPEAP